MGLLSRYPILEEGKIVIPPVLWARLDLGEGHTVMLVSAHPTFGPTKMTKEELRPKRSLRLVAPVSSSGPNGDAFTNVLQSA